MAVTSLLPGYRFHPTDVELVMYYLKRKVMGKRLHADVVAEVNIYMFSPWDLPDKSALKSKDLEWFFFCPREKKHASGGRVKRATENGYWKTTGKDRSVSYKDENVGIVKTLVFHLGHAPNGERTDWVMHEYRIIKEQAVAAGVHDDYVLCKVFQKNGPGPKNGAQYGAPYDEADWADTDDDDAARQEEGRNDAPTMLIGNGSSNGIDDEDDVAHLLGLIESTTGSTDLFSDEINAMEQQQQEMSNNNVNNGDGNNNNIFGDLADLDGWDPMTTTGLDDSSCLFELDSSYDLLPEDGGSSLFVELDDLQAPLDEHNNAGFAEADYSFTVDDFFGLDGDDLLQPAAPEPENNVGGSK